MESTETDTTTPHVHANRHPRTLDKDDGGRLVEVALVIALCLVVLLAFLFSWNALKDIGMAIGGGWAAYIYPLSIDGLLAIALVATVLLTGGTKRFASWVLGGYTVASFTLNYLHALTPRLHAIVRPTVLVLNNTGLNATVVLLAALLPIGTIFLGTELVAQMFRQRRAEVAANTAARHAESLRREAERKAEEERQRQEDRFEEAEAKAEAERQEERQRQREREDWEENFRREELLRAAETAAAVERQRGIEQVRAEAAQAERQAAEAAAERQRQADRAERERQEAAAAAAAAAALAVAEADAAAARELRVAEEAAAEETLQLRLAAALGAGGGSGRGRVPAGRGSGMLGGGSAAALGAAGGGAAAGALPRGSGDGIAAAAAAEDPAVLQREAAVWAADQKELPTGKAVGSRYGRSERWGRDRLAEARKILEERAAVGNVTPLAERQAAADA